MSFHPLGSLFVQSVGCLGKRDTACFFTGRSSTSCTSVFAWPASCMSCGDSGKLQELEVDGTASATGGRGAALWFSLLD